MLWRGKLIAFHNKKLGSSPRRLLKERRNEASLCVAKVEDRSGEPRENMSSPWLKRNTTVTTKRTGGLRMPPMSFDFFFKEKGMMSVRSCGSQGSERQSGDFY